MPSLLARTDTSNLPAVFLVCNLEHHRQFLLSFAVSFLMERGTSWLGVEDRTMSLIKELFGKSPFGPLLEHTRKVHGCVRLVRPLMEAVVKEDYEEVHRLQDTASKLEYEADRVKHEIRENLPRRFFLPVEREDLDAFLHTQDSIADAVEDFAVILLIRNTKVHPELVDEFLEFVDQVIRVSETLIGAAEDMQNLVEASFGGAEANADRMQRKLSQHVYLLEAQLDPVTICFYEKMMGALSAIANAAENTGDLIRTMIVKG